MLPPRLLYVRVDAEAGRTHENRDDHDDTRDDTRLEARVIPCAVLKTHITNKGIHGLYTNSYLRIQKGENNLNYWIFDNLE